MRSSTLDLKLLFEKNRLLYGDARMEEGDEPELDADGKPKLDADGKPIMKVKKQPDKPKSFTQDEVTAIATREKNEGKAAAEKAMATELGIPLADAKKILKAHAEAEKAKKTDADLAAEAVAEEKKAAELEKSNAAKEVHTTRLERAFLREGLEMDDNAKLARVHRMVTVEPGASYEDVLADVKTIKKDFPALFEPEDPAKVRRAPNGDPLGKPPKRTGGEDKYAAGMARAANHRAGFVGTTEKSKTDTKV